jgi:hypothetical protein
MYDIENVLSTYPTLTVRKLIDHLSKMPEDAPIVILGHKRGEALDITYIPSYVESLKDANGQTRVILWAVEAPC